MRSHWVLSLALLVVLVSTPPTSASQGEVRRALDEMHQWLGDGANGRSWRRHLRSPELLRLLDQRQGADVASLQRIHEIYAAPTAGLDRPRFVAVREALLRHIAELEKLDDSRLAQLAREGTQQFQPMSDSELQRRRARVDRAVARLEKYLDDSGPDNARRWKDHLRWDEMLATLQSDEPDLALLHNIRKQYYGPAKGLGTAPFVELRESLLLFMRAQFQMHVVTPEFLDARYQKNLEALAESLEEYRSDYSSDQAVAIGDKLAWLEQSQQLPELIAAVRRRHWLPNVYARASQGVAGAGINDEIRDTSPLRDCLMGATIRGTAYTTGKFFLDFSPAQGRAAMAIRVVGDAYARSTSSKRKVRVFSSANTDIQVEKALYFEEDGRLHGSAATARCETRSCITGISHRSRLVRRIAAKKAAQMKSFGERYAARKAEQQAAIELDSQANPLITRTNRNYDEKIRQPLFRWDVYPRTLEISSADDSVAGVFLVADPSHLGAWNAPPPMPENFDMSLQVHESAVRNVADNMLREYVLNNENAVQLLQDLEMEVPDELRKEEEWSLQFSAHQAISVRFRNGQTRVAIRGQHFTHRGREVTDELEISAEYRAEVAPAGLVMTRIGEVQAEYTDPELLIEGGQSVLHIAIKDVMRRKFDSVFKPEITIEPQKLPDKWSRAGDIVPAYFHSQDGWLSLGVVAAAVQPQAAQRLARLTSK